MFSIGNDDLISGARATRVPRKETFGKKARGDPPDDL